MTDPPSALGIEAVELLGAGERSVTVRVTGRWRRRRPEARGQAMLVVQAGSGRERFPAMPEPPSLTGVAPGTWRMSFSIPAALARELPGRTFLQFGGVIVRLPVGEVAAPGPDEPEERRPRRAELAGDSVRRRADELAEAVNRLEHELDGARAQSERLRAELGERERRLRAAEQHLQAERARRAELDTELRRRSRAAQHDLQALRARVAELERELRRMRRAVAEAEHLAAAAEAGRRAAERRLAERAPPLRAEGNSIEFELLRAALIPSPRRDARPIAGAWGGESATLRLETAMRRARGAPASTHAVALEAELVAAREEIEAQRIRSERAYAAIELARAELRRRQAGPPPRASPQPTSVGQSGQAAPSPRPIQAELSAALARLREQAAPAVTGNVPAGPAADASTEPTTGAGMAKPWPVAVFRALAWRGRRMIGTTWRRLIG